MTTAGLRIDVDTFRGTRDGVPRLLETLEKHDVRATFFFSVGPDNMGRHVWRLLKPAFFLKMLRSDAASLYGWDILLAGTMWPGRRIGRELGQLMRDAQDAGHEIGLHAWDHHAWQSHTGRWNVERLQKEIGRGFDALADILGRAPICSAAAGWRADQDVIEAKENFGFIYNSDCRGRTTFRPRLRDGLAGIPQIPVDMPTYDELASSTCSADDFHRNILARLKTGMGRVHTIHAEVEGISLARDFDAFLEQARMQGVHFGTLGELLPEDVSELPLDEVTRGPLPGREGWVGWQASILNEVS